MVQLSDLPPCLLLKIFSYLPIRDVIRIKLVCKAWQEISCYFRLKSLSLRVFYLGFEIGLSRFTIADRSLCQRVFMRVFTIGSNEKIANFLATNLANSCDANVCLGYIPYNTIESLMPTFDLFYEKIYSVHPNCNNSIVASD